MQETLYKHLTSVTAMLASTQGAAVGGGCGGGKSGCGWKGNGKRQRRTRVGTHKHAWFKVALSQMGLLYGHSKTAVWKLAADDEKRQLCSRSGWYRLATRLADILSLQHWSRHSPTARGKNSLRITSALRAPSLAPLGATARRRPELVAQTDTHRFGSIFFGVPTLTAMGARGKGRRAPLDGEGFAAEVKAMVCGGGGGGRMRASLRGGLGAAAAGGGQRAGA
eukprot:806316-Rhodomonas_salina.2